MISTVIDITTDHDHSLQGEATHSGTDQNQIPQEDHTGKETVIDPNQDHLNIFQHEIKNGRMKKDPGV